MATQKEPPSILVLVRAIRVFRDCADATGLGEMLFSIIERVQNPDGGAWKENLTTPDKRFVFEMTWEAVKKGLDTYQRKHETGKRCAEETNAKRAERKERNAAEPSAPLSLPPPVAPSAPVRKVSADEMMRNFASVNYGEIENDTLNAIGQMLGAQFDAKTKSAIAKLIREKGKANVAQEVCAIRGEWDADELNTINNPAAYVISRLKKLPALKQA